MSNSPITAYLAKTPPANVDAGFLAYIANLTTVAQASPKVAGTIVQELADQRSNLKLIASENYCSLATQLTLGNLLTDKYAEGFPGHRFYAGCDNVDNIESYAAELACRLFGSDHAYVQPFSGSDANLIAFWAILKTRLEVPALAELGISNPAQLSRQDWNKIRQALGGQRLLALDYYSGGHLTHGYRLNISAQMFDVYSYGVNRETGLLDYEALEAQAMEIKPLILLAGYSAYPRKINFRRMRQIADKVGAVLMVDMAHFAGLVAGQVFQGDYSPFPHGQVVTTTTHKTLRGPRGGMILSSSEFSEQIDKGCPIAMGGPAPNVMAAKAVAFAEADSDEFRAYSHKIVENAQTVAQACLDEGMTVATGGTDNHLLLLDVRSFALTGRQAESVLRDCGFTLNRNALPFDSNGPWYTSGLRIGTPAATTLGMGQTEMKEIAATIKFVLANTKPATIKSGKNAGQASRANYLIDPGALAEAQARVKALLDQFPVYPELDLTFLQEHFG